MHAHSNTHGHARTHTHIQALKSNRSIQLLDLSHNMLGPSGSSCVAMALNFNTCLSELRMRANSAGDEAACFMAEAIKRQGTLLPRAAALRCVRAQVLVFVLRAP
jgi:Ran GTPase-activating protein (RanGAP) involved in mRNA processing and transport